MIQSLMKHHQSTDEDVKPREGLRAGSCRIPLILQMMSYLLIKLRGEHNEGASLDLRKRQGPMAHCGGGALDANQA